MDRLLHPDAELKGTGVERTFTRGRSWPRGAIAALGIAVFAVALVTPAASASFARRSVIVADTLSSGPEALAMPVAAGAVFPTMSERDALRDFREGSGLPALSARKAAARRATPAPTRPRAVAAAVASPRPTLSPPGTSGLVIASWYGPGFYGNRTACGQTYTPEIIGVAHRTLRCGTPVSITFRGTTVVVPVIDRGPYIEGRSLDLSNATRAALKCTDLCTVNMQVSQ